MVKYKSLPTETAPELVAKRNARNAKNKAALAKRKADSAKSIKELNRLAVQKALQYEKEYKQADDLLNLQRENAYASGNFFVEPEAKLGFVIRIRGLKSVPPKQKKTLRLLRLLQINNGVFVKINKATEEMLRLVEPFVAWGYVNREVATKLIYTRGYGKVNRQRIAITDNQVVNQVLGDKDIKCIEDLVHEVVTVGPNFKEANNFLWPFKLNAPRGGYRSIKRPYVRGGSFGKRDDEINKLILRCLH